MVGDQSEEVKNEAIKHLKPKMPAGWDFVLIPMDLQNDEELKNYKNDAQLLIAQMQGEALDYARGLNADYFLSIESDVLIPTNAIGVLIDTLKFDRGYYDVAMCTYPSQGGGSFLGGRGNYQHPIAEDYLPEERDMPKELQEKIKRREKDFSKKGFVPDEDWHKEGKEVHEEIKKCPPKYGIWKTLHEFGWRQRGWMEHAYPALGKGCILPTDWVGMGCTMLSKRALELAHFDGYAGYGTQDLHLCWHCWKPNGLNLSVVTHAVCDHIVRARGGEDEQYFDKPVMIRAFHEPEGEYVGHLRQQNLPFYRHIEGERFDPHNDGVVFMPDTANPNKEPSKEDK